MTEHVGINAVTLSEPAAAWLAEQPTSGGTAQVLANYVRACRLEDQRADRERAERLAQRQADLEDQGFLAHMRGESLGRTVADVLLAHDVATALADKGEEWARERELRRTYAEQSDPRLTALRSDWRFGSGPELHLSRPAGPALCDGTAIVSPKELLGLAPMWRRGSTAVPVPPSRVEWQVEGQLRGHHPAETISYASWARTMRIGWPAATAGYRPISS